MNLTNHSWQPHLVSPPPICTGTGLVALDVILDGTDSHPTQMIAGGSCANVLAVLSYLGWRSFPIALLGKDYYSSLVINDLKRFNVETSLIVRDSSSHAPMVVERLLRTSSGNKHVFEFKCPNCGSRLPRNRPFPTELLSWLYQRMPAPQVYYFDRVSKTSLAIARRSRMLGALVMFEPARRSNGALFRKCLRVSHIVKYSIEQLQLGSLGFDIPLEIQTLGSEGLLYRVGSKAGSNWIKSDSFLVPNPIDTAGAGDWCSAGILYELGQVGQAGFRLSRERVEKAIRLGQSLAAIDCSYVGARGAAYTANRLHFQQRVAAMMAGELSKNPSPFAEGVTQAQYESLCPMCSTRGMPTLRPRMSSD